MTNHRAMSRNPLALALACAALLLTSCGKQSAAEKAEEERAAIREQKRKQAVEFYKKFAREYSDDPRAEDASRRATALDAAKKK